MSARKRVNYYRVLELDPSVDDWPSIEKRIEELTHRYNRIRSDASPAEERRAAGFHILINDRTSPNCLRTVMANDALRRKEAEERKKELQAEQDQLDSMLNVLVTRGQYSDHDIKDIAKQLTGFDEDAVRKRLKELDPRGPQEKAETTSRSSPDPDVTSKSEVLGIEDELSGLYCETLYDFLGPNLNPLSSQKCLEDGYEAWKRKLQTIPKGKPEHKVPNSILGHVKKHLLSPDHRRKYDNYLKRRALRGLDVFIRLSGRDTRTITEANINQIITLARLKGVSASDIRKYVKDWVSESKGWTLAESAASTATVARLMCAYCGRIAKDDRQKNCQDCGKLLTMRCPRRSCGKAVPTQDKCCSHCGFHTGDAPVVDELLRQAQLQRRRGDLPGAKELVLRAQALWHEFDGITDELKAIEKLVQQAESREERERKAKETWELAERKRQAEAQSQRDERDAEERLQELKIREEIERRESLKLQASIEEEKRQQEQVRWERQQEARLNAKRALEDDRRRAEQERREEENREKDRQNKEEMRKVGRINRVRQAIYAGRLGDARDRIDRLLTDYPNDEKVRLLETAWEKEREQHTRDLKAREQREQVIDSARALCQDRRYFEADARLAGIVSDDVTELRRRIRRQIDLARQRTDDAKVALNSDSFDVALSYCEEALRHCSDYPDADVTLQLVRYESQDLSRTSSFATVNFLSPRDESRIAGEVEARRLMVVAVTVASVIAVCVMGRLLFWPSFDARLKSIHETVLADMDIVAASERLRQLVADDVERSDRCEHYFLRAGEEFISRAKSESVRSGDDDRIRRVISNLENARAMFELASVLQPRDSLGMIADSWVLQARAMEDHDSHSAAACYGEAATAFVVAAEYYRSIGSNKLATNCYRDNASCIAHQSRLLKESP